MLCVGSEKPKATESLLLPSQHQSNRSCLGSKGFSYQTRLRTLTVSTGSKGLMTGLEQVVVAEATREVSTCCEIGIGPLH